VLKRLHEFIQTNSLITPKDTILLAVSGGMDSMVMLHMFYNVADELDLRLTVLHVNHGTRGAESDADENLVRQLCNDWKLPLKIIFNCLYQIRVVVETQILPYSIYR